MDRLPFIGRIPQVLAPFRSTEGAVAVMVALTITALLVFMAFVLDAGYLYSEKNRYQNAVEAAALAGAVSLCDRDGNDIKTLVREVAGANGIPLEKGELWVRFGYYDEMDRYADFSEYNDFADEESMPAGEYVNAVHVAYRSAPSSLTGMNQGTPVSSTAVAYLQRIDFASLDADGEIQLGHDSIWNGVTFLSNGDIKYPQSASAGGAAYNLPEFNDCQLLAVGQVMSCPVDVVPFGLFSERMEIQWGTGTVQSGSGIWSGVDPLTDIRPVDNDYLDQWRQRADIVYTLDQAGEDNVFFYSDGNDYFIDPAGVHGIIFFDSGDATNAVLQVGPNNDQANTASHTPNGYSIADVTLVATCSIELINYQIVSAGGGLSPMLHVGGVNENQTLFVSARDIKVSPATSGRIDFDGAVFRTGGDFIQYYGGGSGDQIQKIRVIADGNVIGEPYSRYIGSQGVNSLEVDSRFGPPCPPVMPQLGRLEPAG